MTQSVVLIAVVNRRETGRYAMFNIQILRARNNNPERAASSAPSTLSIVLLLRCLCNEIAWSADPLMSTSCMQFDGAFSWLMKIEVTQGWGYSYYYSREEAKFVAMFACKIASRLAMYYVVYYVVYYVLYYVLYYVVNNVVYYIVCYVVYFVVYYVIKNC